MEQWSPHGRSMEHDADLTAWWSSPPSRRRQPIPNPIHGGGSISTLDGAPNPCASPLSLISRLQEILRCCNMCS
ncbi:hypothetical protein SORBI_3009G049701 [Sorghum bicolor]|uniref:Uncharacterized protein n=1 Tax=Sorghum bicolor TaxID=4558 RepID=A0A1Z5R0X5_SORBI|nr:hypothetical protein SORBI_3009G049701 [Sorghum bicolor]